MSNLLSFARFLDEALLINPSTRLPALSSEDRCCAICFHAYQALSAPTTEEDQTQDPESRPEPDTPATQPSKLRRFVVRLKKKLSKGPRLGSRIISAEEAATAEQETEDEQREQPIVFPCGHHVGLGCFLKYFTDNLPQNTCPFCRRELFMKKSNRSKAWRSSSRRRPALSAQQLAHPEELSQGLVTGPVVYEDDQVTLYGVLGFLLVGVPTLVISYVLSYLGMGLIWIGRQMMRVLRAHVRSQEEVAGLPRFG